MKRNKASFSVFLTCMASVFIMVGAGCRSNPDQEESAAPNRVLVPIPDMLQAAVEVGGYTLEAEISISGVGTFPLDVDPDAGTAHFEKSLDPGEYTLTVTYFVMIDVVGVPTRCVLATQSQPATI